MLQAVLQDEYLPRIGYSGVLVYPCTVPKQSLFGALGFEAEFLITCASPSRAAGQPWKAPGVTKRQNVTL